ncbi:hypothetical protein NPIL_6521 [Nephila pilipes]|uniref:Uncharacterized protein n=1 Tax=Nephila pilipes TaxID=299642 RepID=A0A8X6U950_NEPPI|nr:hypothetical protein NPIL_6521 [Nephila pilipes]
MHESYAECYPDAPEEYSEQICGARTQAIPSNNSLTNLTNSAPHGEKLSRWKLAWKWYNLTTSIRKGTQHGNAEALSRLVVDCVD